MRRIEKSERGGYVFERVYDVRGRLRWWRVDGQRVSKSEYAQMLMIAAADEREHH